MGDMAIPESAARFMCRQAERVRQLTPKRRIVFPEGDDPRVIEAAERLAREGLIIPILVGKGKTATAGVTFVDPAHSPKTKEYARIDYERRRSKGLTQMEA